MAGLWSRKMVRARCCATPRLPLLPLPASSDVAGCWAGGNAAQYEHMVVVTEDGAQVLTETPLCEQFIFGA